MTVAEDSPKSRISVEVADNILGILDLTEKVFLTWDFSVLSMAFSQPLLQKRKSIIKEKRGEKIKHNDAVLFVVTLEMWINANSFSVGKCQLEF